jgi:hypothetical protein
MSMHLSEWTLRRLHTGELAGPESQQARAHVSGCTVCQKVMKGFEEEQSDFEALVPLERLSPQVERRMEQPAPAARPRFNGFLVAVAATVLVAVLVRPLLAEPPSPANRTKGGAVAELRIGGEGVESQRVAAPGAVESLAQGERLRLGYTAGALGYVLAVSVDEAGEVSALYPEAGQSLAVEAGAGMHWLPDSQELTGSGLERVVVVLSEQPLEVEAVRAAALRAFEASGRDVAAMPSLEVGGEETHWVLRKP